MNPGDVYLVTQVGEHCPVKIGDRVTVGKRSEFDFLAGGVTTAQEVIREDGSRFMLRRGPNGATLRWVADNSSEQTP